MPEHTIRPKVTEKQISIYSYALMKPSNRPLDVKTQDDRKLNLDLGSEINKDFEENSPYEEGIISEKYQKPNKSQLPEPLELVDLINTNNIVQKYLPKHIYLAQKKLPSFKSAICKVQVLAERYILLESLLFKLITITEKETALLAIPKRCADKIITLYY